MPSLRNTSHSQRPYVSEKHSIRNDTIAIVLGGIILTVLGKLWPPANRAAHAIWSFLAATVPVPAWTLVLLVGGLVVVFVALRRQAKPGRRTLAPKPGSTPAPTPVNAANPLPERYSKFERDLLAFIGKADGEPIQYSDALKNLSATNLKMRAAVDHLVNDQLIDALQAVDDPDHVILTLTSRGRQYVVREGLV